MDYREEAEAIVAARGQVGEGERLKRLLDLDWAHTLSECPELATYAGEAQHNHRWTDWSLEAVERRRVEMEIPARVLATFDKDRLTPADRLHFDLFKRNVDEGLEARRFHGELMPITQLQGCS